MKRPCIPTIPEPDGTRHRGTSLGLVCQGAQPCFAPSGLETHVGVQGHGPGGVEGVEPGEQRRFLAPRVGRVREGLHGHNLRLKRVALRQGCGFVFAPIVHHHHLDL